MLKDILKIREKEKAELNRKRICELKLNVLFYALLPGY